MRSVLFLLLVALGASPARAHGRVGPDELSYQRARQAFYALKADPKQRQDRDHWLAAATRFENVAARYPASARAAEALFTASELRSELSRLSFVVKDRRAALAGYHRVAKLYPHSPLADDALYQAARIELDREDDPEAARADLARLLRVYPKGDMARRSRTLLRTLGPEPKHRAVARAAPQAPAPVAQQEPAEESAEEPAEEPDDDAPKEVPAQGPAAVAADEGPSPQTSEGLPPPRRAGEGRGGGPHAERQAEPALHPTASPAKGAGAPRSAAASAASARALRKAGGAPGGIPLSVQMGLRVRRVVIDAGHGGHDTGAIGPDGTREKDVTLAIARKLADRLRRTGLTVLLVRDGDRFVPLEERAQFANRSHADLFISIHANANTDRKQRGVETYFLDVTSDRYAIRLAARENQSTERSISDLQLLLADLATRSHVEESRRLAGRVQQSLVERIGHRYPPERDLGVKHALFYVLLGTRMPAILVETAFVSNPIDARRLHTRAYQEEVARSVADGVTRFLRDRREMAGL